jgi:hypothetical protein
LHGADPVGEGGRLELVHDETVLDVPVHASAWLIGDVLRGEFGAGNATGG